MLLRKGNSIMGSRCELEEQKNAKKSEDRAVINLIDANSELHNFSSQLIVLIVIC